MPRLSRKAYNIAYSYKTKNILTVSGARKGDVHPAHIGEETDAARPCRSDGGYDDHVLLPPLEGVHGADFHLFVPPAP